MKVFILCVGLTITIVALSQRTKPNTTRNVVETCKPTQSNYTAVYRFVKSKEGLRLKPYYCAAGKRTIGYGHVIQSGEQFTAITKQQADSIFKVDFNKAYNEVLSLGIKNLDTARVLTSFNINCGIKATAKVVRSGNLSKIKQYVYAKGKRLHGLVQRRNQEFALLTK